MGETLPCRGPVGPRHGIATTNLCPRPGWCGGCSGGALMTPVVMIPGDGIGPEVMAATQKVVHAAGARIDWIEAAAGVGAAERFGEPLPEETLDLIRKHRVAL